MIISTKHLYVFKREKLKKQTLLYKIKKYINKLFN